MQALRRWSFWRVLLMSVGWMLLSLLVTAAWTALRLRSQLETYASSGSGGIGSVSVGISETLVWLALLPPIVLASAWAIARWMGKSGGLRSG